MSNEPLHTNSSLAPAPTVNLDGKRVVIVEDEGVTQMLLRHTLTRCGLKVVGFASNGEDAIEIVLSQHPDIVLMDVNIRGEMTGLEAASRILSEYRVCIVMLTAYATTEHQKAAEAIGACGYLLKPLQTDSLLRSLEAAYTKYHSIP